MAQAPVIEIAPGLSYWLAPHPAWTDGDNWPREVPSFCFDSPDGLVLIDPLLPPGGESIFETGSVARVLLTAPWHARDAERIDAPIWRRGDDLPAGIEALHPDGDPDETLFYLREQRALVTGDAFSATDGHFRVFLGDQDAEPFVKWLPRLLESPVERVLVAHGPFVLEHGTLALRQAIGEATVDVLLEQARGDDDVLGLYVFGSRGRSDGLHDERSDWDVCIVLRGAEAKQTFEERWPFVHGAPVEIASTTLDELRAGVDYGSLNVDIRIDKSGEIATILRSRRVLAEGVRDDTARRSLDAYVNSTYRSLRYRMVAAGIGPRLDAAESVPPLLAFLYASEGRVRPFNKYLESELPEFPGLPDRLARVLDGDATEQHALFRDVESVARARGYADVIDSWEPDVAWLRGEAPYREAE